MSNQQGGLYVVSAQKATAVGHSVTGYFTSSTDLNLVIAKGNSLEVHTLTPEGLQGVTTVPIYGRIASLKAFRPPNSDKDLLFILTEKYKFCVLEFDESTGGLVTKANGDASDRVGRPAEAGQIALVDPSSSMFAFHLIDGHLKVRCLTLALRNNLHASSTSSQEESKRNLTEILYYNTDYAYCSNWYASGGVQRPFGGAQSH